MGIAPLRLSIRLGNERERGEETASHPAIIGNHSLAFPLLITRRYADYATILAKVNGGN